MSRSLNVEQNELPLFELKNTVTRNWVINKTATKKHYGKGDFYTSCKVLKKNPNQLAIIKFISFCYGLLVAEPDGRF